MRPLRWHHDCTTIDAMIVVEPWWEFAPEWCTNLKPYFRSQSRQRFHLHYAVLYPCETLRLHGRYLRNKQASWQRPSLGRLRFHGFCLPQCCLRLYANFSRRVIWYADLGVGQWLPHTVQYAPGIWVLGLLVEMSRHCGELMPYYLFRQLLLARRERKQSPENPRLWT